MARLFMNKHFKMDANLMSLWGLNLVGIYAKMTEHGGCLESV
jgi:hypothetical protein